VFSSESSIAARFYQRGGRGASVAQTRLVVNVAEDLLYRRFCFVLPDEESGRACNRARTRDGKP